MCSVCIHYKVILRIVPTYVYHIYIFRRDDLARAIKKIRTLGGGFSVVPIGGKRFVQCVPGELSLDHTQVLQLAEVNHL